MNKENKVDIELIKKFFNKTCTEPEKEKVINWFVDYAFEQKLSFVLKKHWDELDHENIDIDGTTEKILNKIHHQIHLENFDKQNNQLFINKAVFYFSRIAAIFIIPVLLYAVYMYNQNTLVDYGDLPNQKTAYAEILSPLGARTHFTLPDGSSGWLNSGSTLKFPVKFSGNERNLELVGEAWFDVVENPKVPFVVNALGVDVVALGTKFNIRAYHDDKFVDITLESGKVVVNRKTKGQTKLIAELKPDDKVSISREEPELIKEKNVETEKITAWKEGKLIMRNEKMSEVFKKLERWYNIKIIVKDKEIEDYRYRATFQDETIDEILRLLKLTSPIDYLVKQRETEDGVFTKKEIILFLKKE
ncbi:MAG: FecR domain-containing protein [Bacteroidota bacterium]